jgi:hypothetical protein
MTRWIHEAPMTAARRRLPFSSDESLLGKFASAFGVLDELIFFPQMTNDGVLPKELGSVVGDSLAQIQQWRPAAIQTDADALAAVYTAIVHRFPPLYEHLILSYRWLEVDLQDAVTLLPNPPGGDLSKLLAKITADPIFVKVLFPLGLIPFGRASGGSLVATDCRFLSRLDRSCDREGALNSRRLIDPI